MSLTNLILDTAMRQRDFAKLGSGSFLLSKPEALPFRDAILEHKEQKRVVIVAPHPDDETLGCGGAIALLCQQGCDVSVLVVSDGTLSHPHSRKYPAPALRLLREQETLKALAILGVDQDAITFLQLKDGSLPFPTSLNFQTAKALCQNYLKKARPDVIFLPWREDPHSDHRATWKLIQAALRDLEMTIIKCIEYPIWDWDIRQQKQTSFRRKISGWRLDITTVLEQKHQAIAAYRSQLGQVIDDDPNGFCLAPEMLVNFRRPWEVYFEEIA